MPENIPERTDPLVVPGGPLAAVAVLAEGAAQRLRAVVHPQQVLPGHSEQVDMCMLEFETKIKRRFAKISHSLKGPYQGLLLVESAYKRFHT